MTCPRSHIAELRPSPVLSYSKALFCHARLIVHENQVSPTSCNPSVTSISRAHSERVPILPDLRVPFLPDLRVSVLPDLRVHPF